MGPVEPAVEAVAPRRRHADRDRRDHDRVEEQLKDKKDERAAEIKRIEEMGLHSR